MYIIIDDCRYGKKGVIISEKEFKTIPYQFRRYFEKFSTKKYVASVQVDNTLTRKLMEIPESDDLSFAAFRELNFPDTNQGHNDFSGFGGGDFSGAGAGGDW